MAKLAFSLYVYLRTTCQSLLLCSLLYVSLFFAYISAIDEGFAGLEELENQIDDFLPATEFDFG